MVKSLYKRNKKLKKASGERKNISSLQRDINRLKNTILSLQKTIAKRNQEIKSWEETCEIMSNPELIKGLISSLEDINQGRYYVLEKDSKGNIILTKGKKRRKPKLRSKK